MRTRQNLNLNRHKIEQLEQVPRILEGFLLTNSVNHCTQDYMEIHYVINEDLRNGLCTETR